MSLLNRGYRHDHVNSRISQLTMINGYLVVRRPERNCYPQGDHACDKTPPVIDGVHYAGVHRMPWFDLKLLKWSRDLDGRSAALLKSIGDCNDDFSGIDLCFSLDDALQLLKRSNEINDESELIAVWSGILTQIKGEIAADDNTVEWLGKDVLVFGGHSLIKEGIFFRPELFGVWKDVINEHGLFPIDMPIDDFVRDAQALARRGLIEDYGVLTNGSFLSQGEMGDLYELHVGTVRLASA